jgi:hypothetical protein
MSVSLSLRTWRQKQIQFPKTLCFLEFRIKNDGQSPETPLFLVLHTIVRTLQIYFRHILQ